ncbi:Na/Pi cotransporter family protein [bacterium]|nr:Na/Pi cotransporter family protein [FCB group bacterium]MBL7191916.1 Na/Pi cotransporter family protein [bacterium]
MTLPPSYAATPPSKAVVALKILALLSLLYLFLVSITLMGDGLKMLGKDFIERFIASTSSAPVGLFIGILTTSIVQSSSTTTSIVVGLVGSGFMTLTQAIPIVMGANIGTSVTNTLVALGQIDNKVEFQRAFGAAVVDDIFNLLAVIVFLPLQVMFNFLGFSAQKMGSIFFTSSAIHFKSPLKMAVNPMCDLLEIICFHNGWVMLALAFVILILSLRFLMVVMKSLVMRKASKFFDEVIFRTPLMGMFFGMALTAVVQSSSVTTSLIVPLAGAGLVSLEQLFPYVLGANVGTTVTALMASLVTNNVAAVNVAFAHMLFNMFGILMFMPLKFIPIGLAKKLAAQTVRSKLVPLAYILIVFFIIPIVLIQLLR